jgi:hypothetical protein
MAQAQKLHDLKMKNIAAENAEQAKSNQAATTTTQQAVNTQTATTTDTKRIELVIGNKSAVVYADANNSAQLESLISQLQQEALRA